MAKSKNNSRRVTSVNATRLRRILRDESGRVPQDNFDLSKVALPDWFYEPKHFQKRVELRRLKVREDRRKKLIRNSILVGLGFLALSEDGREWHPGRQADRRPRMLDGRPVARFLEKTLKARAKGNTRRRSSSAAWSSGFMSFSDPQVTAICVRRKMRRQVIFATRKNGRGNRPPRRNQWSTVRC